MGAFWDLIQAGVDRQRDPRFKPPSDRELARQLNVSPGTIGNWKKGLNDLPSRRNLRAVADFVGLAYEEVLLTALSETGHAEGTRLQQVDRLAAERRRRDETVERTNKLRRKGLRPLDPPEEADPFGSVMGEAARGAEDGPPTNQSPNP